MILKKFLSVVTAGVVVSSMFIGAIPSMAYSNANAKEKVTITNNLRKVEKSNISKVLGINAKVSVREWLTVNNEEIPLYCTFEDKDEAIKEIKSIASNLLEKIKNTYELSEFNNENWKDYRDSLNKYIDEKEITDDENIEYSKLMLFFDVYENDEQNDEIKNYINVTRSGIDENLIILLPYDSECDAVQEFNQNALAISEKTRMMRGYNLNNAKTYATKYATSPNKSGYGYFSTRDCTNFVSQILEAAGVSQEVYTSENSGWWHKNNNGNHTYSVSWIRARTFAKYMGIGYKTTNHYDFSASIKEGDFIGFDRAGDGDIDHNAFVMASDNYASNYNGMNYYDYKVAQHTNNYCAWTSSDKNNWETLEDYTCVYARIRR